MGGDEAMDKFEICMGANLTCMNDLMNRMGEFDHVDYQGKQTKCRSACEDQVSGSQSGNLGGERREERGERRDISRLRY